jgi:hypothetical protein
MIARTTAIIPVEPSATHVGKEGYAVTFTGGKAVLCAANTDAVNGVITEGSDTTGKDSVAVPGFGGTVKVKLGSSAGTIVLGTMLEIKAGGTWKADAGTSGTVAAMALEAGTDDELIEAVLLNPTGTITLEQSWHTDIDSTYADPALTVAGQVQDAAGNDLAGYFVVGVYFSEAANTGIPFDFGDLAAGSGSVIIKEHTSDALCEVLTKSDGSWSVVMTLSGSDTVHTAAWVIGKTAADNSGALTVA